MQTASRLENPEDAEDDGKKKSVSHIEQPKKASSRPPVGVSYSNANNPAKVEAANPKNKDLTPRDSQRPLKRLSLTKKDSSREYSKGDQSNSLPIKNLEIDELGKDKSKEDDKSLVDNNKSKDSPAYRRDSKQDESDELPVRQSPAKNQGVANGDNVVPTGPQPKPNENVARKIHNDRGMNMPVLEGPGTGHANEKPTSNSRDPNLNKLMGRADTSKLDSLADLIEGDVESKFYTRRGTIEGTDPNEPNFARTANYSDRNPDLPSRGFRDAYDPEKELSSIKMEGDDDRGSNFGRDSPNDKQGMQHGSQPNSNPKSDNHRNSATQDYPKTVGDKRPLSSAGNQGPKARAREMSVDQNGDRGANVVPEPRGAVSKAVRSPESPQKPVSGEDSDGKQRAPPSVQLNQAKPAGNGDPKASQPQDMSKSASQLPPKTPKPVITEPYTSRAGQPKESLPPRDRSLDPLTNLAESPRSGSFRKKGSDRDHGAKDRRAGGELPLIGNPQGRAAEEDSVDSPEKRRDKMPPLPKLAQSSGSQPHARPSETHRFGGPGKGQSGLPSAKPSEREVTPRKRDSGREEPSELPRIGGPPQKRSSSGSGKPRLSDDVVAESLPNGGRPNLGGLMRPIGVPGMALPDSDTMYLDLVMDESLDIELNIEEMEDEEEGASDGDKRKTQPQYEIIGSLRVDPEHPPQPRTQGTGSPSRTSNLQ